MDGAFTLLYRSLASRLSDAIVNGSLKAGDRLPSVRRLSAQHRVSISTAVQAYRHLENARLIEARPKSGYFVLPRGRKLEEPQLSKPPAAARFVGVNRYVMEYLECSNLPDVAPLGCATPSEQLYPGEKLVRLASSIARRNPSVASRYTMSMGHDKLRSAIARRAVEFGCNLSASEIVVTNGCTEALNLALRAVAQPGDTIALESPTYFTLLQIIESLGMKALEIPTHPREGISLEALELALDREKVKACLLMPNVSNPLGSTMPDAAKKRLVQLLVERDVPLIEDGIYNALCFAATPPYAAKAYDRKGLVMLCSSFTKSLAPGFRVGWVAAGRHYEQVRILKFMSSGGMPELLQLAVAEFLENGGYDRHLRSMRRTYARQTGLAQTAVAQHFPPGTRATRPTGGFVLWVELPKGCDAVELYEQAMQERIGFAPGPMFSATDRYHNCLRLSCAVPWTPRVEGAIARLGELAHRLAGRAGRQR